MFVHSADDLSLVLYECVTPWYVFYQLLLNVGGALPFNISLPVVISIRHVPYFCTSVSPRSFFISSHLHTDRLTCRSIFSLVFLRAACLSQVFLDVSTKTVFVQGMELQIVRGLGCDALSCGCVRTFRGDLLVPPSGWHTSPPNCAVSRAMTSSFLGFLDHTPRAILGRTLLDE